MPTIAVTPTKESYQIFEATLTHYTKALAAGTIRPDMQNPTLQYTDSPSTFTFTCVRSHAKNALQSLPQYAKQNGLTANQTEIRRQALTLVRQAAKIKLSRIGFLQRGDSPPMRSATREVYDATRKALKKELKKKKPMPLPGLVQADKKVALSANMTVQIRAHLKHQEKEIQQDARDGLIDPHDAAKLLQLNKLMQATNQNSTDEFGYEERYTPGWHRMKRESEE